MQNWDLYIFFPILFVFAIFAMSFMCYKEKIPKKSYLLIVQIILFWIVIGYIGNSLSTNISNSKTLSSGIYIILLIFSSSLFLLFLKPLATWSTGIFKNRKIWIQSSYITSIIALIILIVLGNNLSIWSIIFISIIYSFSLATSTLYYLYFNEQFFYRIYTLPTTWIIFTFITFSTTFGLYINILNTEVVHSNTNIVIPIIFIIFLIICFLLSFLQKENKNLVGSFDAEVIIQLPKKNNWTFLIIYFLIFLISVTSALNNSLIIKIYMTLNLINLNYSNFDIETLLRVNNFIYIIPSIIISYFIYKYALKYLNQKDILFISIFLLFTFYTVLAFAKNPFIFIGVNFFTGICLNQILYSLFSVCMFWNYRAPRNPVTGFWGTAYFGGQFLVITIEEIISKLNIGVFKNFSSVNELLSLRDELNLSEYYSKFNNVSTLCMTFACVITLIVALLFYFKSNKIFADFVNYRLAIQNLKVILKKRVIEKTKTKMKIEITNVEGDY